MRKKVQRIAMSSNLVLFSPFGEYNYVARAGHDFTPTDPSKHTSPSVNYISDKQFCPFSLSDTDKKQLYKAGIFSSIDFIIS